MTVRVTWRRALLALAGLALAALLFAWSGLFNVAASTGHWKITDVVVHRAMRNSVRTHAAFQTPEQVRDDTGLVSAAGHFAQACASCHGAPGVRPLPVMQRATPPAPHLPDHLHEWSDRQLFWILEHGVRLTGMPAWAARDRPDEIRRMVAFVRRLPSITPERYRALVEASGAIPVIPGVAPRIVANCVGCHGADGQGRGQRDIPVLGGQRADYLARALAEFASGRRDSAVMTQAAATLTPAERRALAGYFAARPGLGAASADVGEARAIVERGLHRRQLPACASCHRAGSVAPVLAGQRAVYIAERLRHWRGDETVVDARKPQDVMPVIARRLPPEAIEPLARYYEGAARHP